MDSSKGSGAKTTLGRRGFLEIGVWLFPSGVALVLGLPGLRYLLAPIWSVDGKSWVDLGEVGALRSIKTPIELRFQYQSKSGFRTESLPGLVILGPSAENSDLTVLSPVCTHKGCNVAWAAEESLFVCPCHGGRYALDGRVASGPPPAPLGTIPSEIREGHLWIEYGGGEG